MIDYNDDVPEPLADAVRRLRREEYPPTDVWRRRVLNAVASSAPPDAAEPAMARWSLRPVTAIAAALVCALVGGATTAVILRSESMSHAMASAPALSHVRFALTAPQARRVYLVGDFNEWNPRALPLRKSRDGRTWVIDVPLAPGRYTYAFMVDNALARDPSAPEAASDDFGAPSSVVLVARANSGTGEGGR
jgi:hypothetical protein